DGHTKEDQNAETKGRSIFFNVGHGLLRELWHQQEQHQAEQNERRHPNDLPDVVVPFHVLRLALDLMEVHRRGKFRAGGDFRRVIAVKANRAVALGGRADVQRISFGFHAAGNLPGKAGMLGEDQQIAANLPVQAQILCKDGGTAADFGGGVDVNAFIGGKDVPGDFSADGYIVRAGTDVAVDVPGDVQGLCKGDYVAFDRTADAGVFREHVDVAFDRAVHARAVAEKENVAFDFFVL